MPFKYSGIKQRIRTGAGLSTQKSGNRADSKGKERPKQQKSRRKTYEFGGKL